MLPPVSQQNAEVYHSLQAVVKDKYGKSAAAVGDEGVARQLSDG